MALAIIYPDPTKVKRAGSSETEDLKVSSTRLSMARTVLEYTPDLPANVVLGTMSLDAAYEKARARKLVATGEVARLAHLRKSYPELADKVVEGVLTVKGAEAEAEERTKQAKHDREALYQRLGRIHSGDSVMGTRPVTCASCGDNRKPSPPRCRPCSKSKWSVAPEARRQASSWCSAGSSLVL